MSLSSPRATLAALLVVAAVAAGGLALFVAGVFEAEAEPHVFAGVLYDPPESVPDLVLTRHDGEPFTLHDLEGDVVVIYFGYTHCPDVCPLTLSNLARAKELLPDDLRDDLQVVMVTVDPARDTTDVLANYIPHFDEDFIGLSGTAEEVKRVTDAWALRVELGQPDVLGNYAVGHPAFTIVLDRDGRRRLKLNHLLTVEQVTADLRAVLEDG